jgi:hypothetical protein
MSVKTLEIVRKIRDRNYRETKDLPIEEQIRIVQKKASSFTNKSKRRITAER